MRLEILLAAAGLVCLAECAGAFTLTPMSETFTPSGGGAAKSFRVENESSNRVAFQITMVTREMDENGQESLQPAGELFTVFPPQGIIAAGQSQSIRVVWKGPASPTNELAFRLVAEELPVNFALEKDKAQIRVLVRYMAALYVRPRNAKPALQLSSLTRTDTNYVMTVTNSGGAHQSLLEPQLTLTDAQGQSRTLTAAQLPGLAGQNVLAHHTRRFALALPDGFNEPTYRAQIKINE